MDSEDNIMLLWFAMACDKGKSFSDSYAVTVTGYDVTEDDTVTNCTDDTTGYRESYIYTVNYLGSTIQIDIDGKYFATGKRNGCTL